MRLNSIRIWTCLINCNRHYNVIDILMRLLFSYLVIFLLQLIVIPYE